MAATPDPEHDLLPRFSAFLAQHIGLHYPPQRWTDLLRGMQAAARAFGFGDATSCMQWLLTAPLNRKQIEILAVHLTIGETYFLRDPQVFEALETSILPALIQSRRQSEKRLRIWSAGCSSGEEAYSLAIVLQRLLPDYKHWRIAIVGTDINPRALQKAALGVYHHWSFRNAPLWLTARYFREIDQGRYEIIPEIRNMVTFSYLNLAEDVYPSLANNTNAMDIIFCRNVLMYFTPEIAAKIVRKHCSALVDGGWLVAGPAEISPASINRLETVYFPGAILYRKNAAAAKPTTRQDSPLLPSCHEADSIAAIKPAAERKPQPLNPRKTPPLPPPSLYEQALTLYRQGRYAQAEEYIMRLLAEQKDNIQALHMLVRIHANQGKLATALQWCERALVADRLNPAGHYLSAMVLLEMGQMEDAVLALKRTLYLDQDFILAYFSLGNLSQSLGRRKQAAKHFNNTLALLEYCSRDAVLPESEGITAGRLIEILRTLERQEQPV